VLRLTHYPPNPLPREPVRGWRRIPIQLFYRPAAGQYRRALYPATRALGPEAAGSSAAHPRLVVINAGDMCRRWTNDRFLSTQHLAINLTDQHRYSTPFFYTPHIDHKIACLPTCVGIDNPPRYPPILWRVPRVVAQHQFTALI